MNESSISDFQERMELTVQKLREESNYGTSADIGLILRVLEDSLREERYKREIITLETATKMLYCRHNIEELTWFDIYSSVIMSWHTVDTASCSEKSESDNKETLDFFREFSIDNCENGHQSEFENSVVSLAESILSDSPYSSEEKEEIGSLADVRCGFLYGDVEIPNHMSRASLVDEFVGLDEQLPEDDFRWMVHTLETWVRMYAHAESMMTHENTEYSDLREYMIDNETPMERFY